MKNRMLSINYKIYLLALGTLAIAGTSCKKSFLDQTPYTAVPATSAVTNEASMYTAVVGMYSSLRATDFYGRTFAIKGDLMSDNAFLSTQNSGRYTGFNNYDMDKTNGYPSAIWQNSYAAIKNTNLIINSNLAISNDNISQLYAEAYALRGMIYFDLVRNFALPYVGNENKPGVPIVLEFNQSIKPARDTISKVYAQILSDLNRAYSLAKYDLGSTMTFLSTGATRAVNTSFVTKYVIEALLARVYQHMGNWAAAKTAALDVVNNGGYSLIASTALVGYWAGTAPRQDKVETMFEVTSDANNSVSDGTLANLYVPKPTGSYGDILATKALYDSYAATDVRRGLYNPSTRTGQLGTAYYVTKYPINTISYDDVKVVRYADVLLILAEACYNTSDETNALKYVNMVAQKRDPSFAGYTTTGAAVLESILTERQKELAFEGYRFWDLYRLKRTFTKPQAQDANSVIVKSVVVSPATRNIVFPIPYDEVLVNKGIQQNDGY
ncbi:RagB/SusD family nutrient uptake outer membrane protein [Niastella caeni]|uniref:RagB/SusD family nutrient uptake outer membrane protein n=1 Tax=Niastella caeni TaxID=2569763 RepID=A0A4S8I154_9BACT|nr:RagB/SusD family nutrient uptake outer membrane protein [Niastella caeni]THU40919.1 RagB/SusD family nutrient uptake outer membrane protein [Niastella caeni]